MKSDLNFITYSVSLFAGNVSEKYGFEDEKRSKFIYANNVLRIDYMGI